MKRFNDLNIGDIINYDIELRNKSLKNETALILDKNVNMLKLSVLSNVWYCSVDMFYQLKNVSVIEEENKYYDFNLKWKYDKEKNILSIDTKSFDNISGCMFDMKLNDTNDFENVDNACYYLTSGLYKIENKETFFKILNDYLKSTN